MRQSLRVYYSFFYFYDFPKIWNTKNEKWKRNFKLYACKIVFVSLKCNELRKHSVLSLRELGSFSDKLIVGVFYNIFVSESFLEISS